MTLSLFFLPAGIALCAASVIFWAYNIIGIVVGLYFSAAGLFNLVATPGRRAEIQRGRDGYVDAIQLSARRARRDLVE